MFLMLMANPLFKYIAVAVTIVIFCAGLYFKGRSDGGSAVRSEYAVAEAEWRAKVSEKQRELNQAATEFASNYTKQSAIYQAELNKLKNNPTIIDRFVPSTTSCNVPNGFVDLLNKAATGSTLEPTPGVNVAATSDKPLPQVAGSVAENYLNCKDTIDRLTALQAIVKQFQAKQKELIK